MNSRPLISVIVPVYKTPEIYLRSCIESVLQQNIQNFELILVDDGSPDQCGIICDEYVAIDRRVIVIHQENKGVSSARNAGLKRAEGKYLTFLDADDLLLPNTWEVAITSLERYNADCVVFGWNDFNVDGKWPHTVANQIEEVSVINFQQKIASDNFLCGGGYPWNKVWNADRIREVHGDLIEFNTDIYTYEDKLWILEVSDGLEKILLIPDVLYDYRFLPSSLTQSEDAWKHRQFNAYEAYDKILDFLQGKNKQAYEGALKFYFHFCYIDLTILYRTKSYEKHRYKKTKRSLWKLSKRIKPGELHQFKYNLAWIYFLLFGWI